MGAQVEDRRARRRREPARQPGQSRTAHKAAPSHAAEPSKLRRALGNQAYGKMVQDRLETGEKPVDLRPGMLVRLTKLSDKVGTFGYVPPFKVGDILEIESGPHYFYRQTTVVVVLAPLPGRERGTTPFHVDVSRVEPVTTPRGTGGAPGSAPPEIRLSTTPPAGLSHPQAPGFAGPTVYVVVDLKDSAGDGFGPPGMVPGLAMGSGRGLGFVQAPPLRGSLKPRLTDAFSAALEPSWLRSRGFADSLGPLPGGGGRLERYVGSNVLGQLEPRFYGPEGRMLAELDYFRRTTPGYTPAGYEEAAKWMDVFGVGPRQLGEVRELLARASAAGLDSLSDADRALLLAVVEAHAQGGQVFASPLLSGTARQGVSLVEGIPGTITKRPYLVQIELPANAPVADVNELLGDRRLLSLVKEGEQVFDTTTGARIRAVAVNPSSSLGRFMKVFRYAGPVLETASLGYSGYRIATASDEDRIRVAGEEIGGTAGGYVGSAGGVAFCVVAGIASGGWILLGCSVVGGVAGGLGGSYLGGRAASRVQESAEVLGEVYGPLIEKSIFGDRPRPGYYPPRGFAEDPFEYEQEKNRYYEEAQRRFDRGEGPPPFL